MRNSLALRPIYTRCSRISCIFCSCRLHALCICAVVISMPLKRITQELYHCVYLRYKMDAENTTPQPFYGPFFGTTRVSRCQKRTSRLYGTREDQQRQTHRPSGWAPHSIQTNQCPPPPTLHFFTGQMPFLPPHQQCQSAEGN